MTDSRTRGRYVHRRRACLRCPVRFTTHERTAKEWKALRVWAERGKRVRNLTREWK